METVETGYSLKQHVEGESRHLDAPILRLELDKELVELRDEAGFDALGHSGKTLVKYPDLRVVLIAINKGARLGEHHTPERMTLQCLSGRVRLELPDQELDLPAGGLVTLERDLRHDVEALEQSAILLTICWRGRPPAEDVA